jgi:hypothetical protein
MSKGAQVALFGLDDEEEAEERVLSGAVLSACGRYRYILMRIWDTTKPLALMTGCNPSTADAETNDPTIVRGMKHARRWGCGGLLMGNLLPYRETDPDLLHGEIAAPGLLGERNADGDLVNDAWLRWAVEQAAVVVAAWGAIELPREVRGRAREAMALLGDDVQALRITKHGHPGHPLYVAYGTELVAYAGVSG